MGVMETKHGKETKRFQIDEPKQTPGELKGQIIQNDIGYADDTQLLIEKDTHEQLCERIGNYDIAAETRELKIQWAQL